MKLFRLKAVNSTNEKFSQRARKACIKGLDEHIYSRRKLLGALLGRIEEALAIRPVMRALEGSVFMRQGDYWMIHYDGKTAILKATRGLECLCYLLRHPARDVHVSELLTTPIDRPMPALLGSLRAADADALTARLQDAGPILDSQAKAEYQRRVDELREDMEEANQFNDSYRVARIRTEMDSIVEQLSAAIGLGGRDRRASCDAERARSAVTKRIKEAINKIGDVIPPLGGHLASRIKTGYFCSYNPHPDRLVAWKF